MTTIMEKIHAQVTDAVMTNLLPEISKFFDIPLNELVDLVNRPASNDVVKEKPIKAVPKVSSSPTQKTNAKTLELQQKVNTAKSQGKFLNVSTGRPMVDSKQNRAKFVFYTDLGILGKEGDAKLQAAVDLLQGASMEENDEVETSAAIENEDQVEPSKTAEPVASESEDEVVPVVARLRAETEGLVKSKSVKKVEPVVESEEDEVVPVVVAKSKSVKKVEPVASEEDEAPPVVTAKPKAVKKVEPVASDDEAPPVVVAKPKAVKKVEPVASEEDEAQPVVTAKSKAVSKKVEPVASEEDEAPPVVTAKSKAVSKKVEPVPSEDDEAPPVVTAKSKAVKKVEPVASEDEVKPKTKEPASKPVKKVVPVTNEASDDEEESEVKPTKPVKKVVPAKQESEAEESEVEEVKPKAKEPAKKGVIPIEFNKKIEKWWNEGSGFVVDKKTKKSIVIGKLVAGKLVALTEKDVSLCRKNGWEFDVSSEAIESAESSGSDA